MKSIVLLFAGDEQMADSWCQNSIKAIRAISQIESQHLISDQAQFSNYHEIVRAPESPSSIRAKFKM